ncbi:CPBP family intramembrane glutamic endopeptidase [Phaeobacter sp. HF9A]|uniref:CPBP family intramembrane glutamic endopeptidase n=1 Tax=Phaeobacter sp. HF9A TaxID=2721561 RepID=UPI001431FEF4|nr:type II CAAX endopeptidase family protein [Phaeobacter sp. HF9A]NIZ12509.1 CPBP family intramembrane metalloprotease [Phaeobacter sp. HF9A]
MSTEAAHQRPARRTEDGSAQLPQWSAAGLLGLWLLVTLPMAGLSLGLAPYLIARLPDADPGLIFWKTIIAGMAWQTVVSIGVLAWEGQGWTLDALRRGLWLRAPSLHGTKRANWAILWRLVPVGVLCVLAVDSAFGWLDAVLAARLPEWLVPSYADITALATAANKGNWSLLWIALVSSVFNYGLGEALFFHGILLPRMVQTFGRRAWAVNAVAFGLYHAHKAAVWPTVILSCVAYSWPAQYTRSIWPALLIHGFEGLVLIAAVLLVVLGGPL